MDQNRPSGDSGESSDVDLLRRCAAGEAGGLRLLFERHAGPLADYLYRILGSREDAEEAVADVFVRAWRAAGGFKGDAAVRSWLYRIALNVGIDRMRSRRRAPSAMVPFSDLEEQLVASVTDEPEAVFFSAYQRERDRRALRLALQRLAPRDRALLALLYFEGCSYEQIGEITGAPPVRVKSRLHDARQRLKRHFVAYRDSDEALEPQDDTTDHLPWGPRELPVF
jgi:RNA polymerase sigma-70 factor, ECF subfamily